MENLQQVVVGGGCFWCVEAVMQRLKGVVRLESGYCGGSQPNPTYREVCSGITSHAEVVRITFDPKVISLHDLLTIFMTTHDPTTLNRQGNDKGTQYRSIVFYQDDAQKATILQVFDAIKHIFPDPIVTEVSPAMPFYPAEDYHQNYYNDNPVVPYCRIVISPKVEKLRHYYSAYLKGQS
ncbi:MAG: peptide-methionine (S)-S-oxide reductase MsrA [Saprospiraceae bacterium]|nr:peptide-methionine (S)-S-oxide reductase MsrA [Saprospiraceae bacterium]